MNTSSRTFFALAVAAIMVACDLGSTTFTLYRHSTQDETMRIHVASFDATASETYNRGNCERGAGPLSGSTRSEDTVLV